MQKHIIPNVPRIAQFTEGGSMLTPFIGALYATLHGLGRPRPYADLLALSGAFCRLRWVPGVWDGSNADILNCEDPPFAPHHRALRAVGITGEVRQTKPHPGLTGPLVTEEQARADIVRSVDAGIPVIAMGILGPPECCVVHGYDEDGTKLIGWNYFQADEGFAADQPFVKANWFENLTAYILLTPADETPTERESALTALRAAVSHAHHADVRGAHVGLAAWESALAQLEHAAFDDCVQTLLPGPADMWSDWPWNQTIQGRFCVYCDVLVQVYERGAALPFWERMRAENPDWAGALTQAIDAWRACAQYGGFVWQHVTNDPAGFEAFATPEIRKILADEGHRSMTLDQKAIEAIQTIC